MMPLVWIAVAVAAWLLGAWVLHYGLPTEDDHDAKAVAAMKGDRLDSEGREE